MEQAELRDSFPARTMDGSEVRIVEKRADGQRVVVLVAADGTEYVEDVGTGLLLTLDQAPLTGLADPAKEAAAQAEKGRVQATDTPLQP
jgi:hypothetical protein